MKSFEPHVSGNRLASAIDRRPQLAFDPGAATAGAEWVKHNLARVQAAERHVGSIPRPAAHRRGSR